LTSYNHGSIIIISASQTVRPHQEREAGRESDMSDIRQKALIVGKLGYTAEVWTIGDNGQWETFQTSLTTTDRETALETLGDMAGYPKGSVLRDRLPEMEIDPGKIRRRVEDMLRKAPLSTILKIAGDYGVKIAE
jgi:hypothetical protein